ncbi:PaaX family transcriptional regulator C-terminal domain-containing protein [Kineosporia sp. NBRC 101731]|uniref:PaaX family transcriptional regulator n=1 Tax=Kineosporia sp. NBRC 101731 TaxID=3032199 RepID=UPI00249F95D6|nr:PaaX family transcriptional regulator C-terminal domain-containing protein [Kineosporia sp. NBRC 101731]GLY31039.1 PaaX family transcriptional regulator [Kineosporia sp. NBRC 101731]
MRIQGDTDADTDAEESGGRAAPRSLIVTTYGLYARRTQGWMSVAGLIRLMSFLDVEAPAVRSSILRLKRRGVLEAERRDGVAGYTLSAGGLHILQEGDRRIFEHPRAGLSDGWLLAVFSIPESERNKRHLLRSRLTWLGFGTVSSGVWIAPGHLEADARAVLSRDGLDAFVNLFRSDYLGFGRIEQEAARWWDLAGLAAQYEDFLGTWQARLVLPHDDAEAFRDYLTALTLWRRLPFLDPGLPVEVVGPDWAGERAGRLFSELRRAWEGPAERHVRSLV